MTYCTNKTPTFVYGNFHVCQPSIIVFCPRRTEISQRKQNHILVVFALEKYSSLRIFTFCCTAASTYLRIAGRWWWFRTSRRPQPSSAYPCSGRPAIDCRRASSSSERRDCDRTAGPLSRGSPWQLLRSWSLWDRPGHRENSHCYRLSWSCRDEEITFKE